MARERDTSLGFVFPGQGAQRPDMLTPFAHDRDFERVVDFLAAHLGLDPREAETWSAEIWRRNLVSSLMTVAASVLCLRRWRLHGAREPGAVMGYSVGQWSALHAAGCLDEAALFGAVAARARLMDEVVALRPPSGMLAVIGVRIDDGADICARAARDRLFLQVANDNAPGQFTLAGDLDGLAYAEAALPALRPKKVMRLEAAGAWHSEWMRPAVAPLRTLVHGLSLASPDAAIGDNVTGALMPEGPVSPESLATHVASPVLWRRGMRVLIDSGVQTFVEVGYGAMLSQFGAFISRDVKHQPLHPPPARGAR